MYLRSGLPLGFGGAFPRPPSWRGGARCPLPNGPSGLRSHPPKRHGFIEQLKLLQRFPIHWKALAITMLVLKSITNTSALLLCFYVATRFVVYRILWTLFDTLCVSGTDDISESGGNCYDLLATGLPCANRQTDRLARLWSARRLFGPCVVSFLRFWSLNAVD